MSEQRIQAATPVQRLTLVSVADLAGRDQDPVHSYDVRRACESHTRNLEAAPFAGVSRQEVINALTELAAAGLLVEAEVTSPVGKGRPAYALAADPEAVLRALAKDDHLADIVARIRARED